MSSELKQDDAKLVRDFLNHPAFEDMPHNCQTKAILASEAFDRLMAATAQPSVKEFMERQFSDPETKAIYDRLSGRETAQHPAVEDLPYISHADMCRLSRSFVGVGSQDKRINEWLKKMIIKALTSQTPAETSEKPPTKGLKK